jgi:hypothetical protein
MGARSQLLNPPPEGGELTHFTSNGALLGVPQPLDNVEGPGELGVRLACSRDGVTVAPFGEQGLPKLSEGRIFARFRKVPGGASCAGDGAFEPLDPGRAIDRRVLAKVRSPDVVRHVSRRDGDEDGDDRVIGRHDRPPCATPSAELAGTSLHGRAIPLLGVCRDAEGAMGVLSGAKTVVPGPAAGRAAAVEGRFGPA